MVTTRSSSKRKSAEGTESETSLVKLPSSASKPQQLPVRRKGRSSSGSTAVGKSSTKAEGASVGKAEPINALETPQATENFAHQRQENPSVGTEPASTVQLPDIIKFDDADFSMPMPTPLRSVTSVAKETTETQGKGGAKAGEAAEESDDEAPEAVSNVQAAVAAKEAAQVTQRAAKEETQRLKRKRQERDTKYKEQAQARKQAAEVEPQPAARGAANVKQETGKATGEEAPTEKNLSAAVAQSDHTLAHPLRRPKSSVPDVLPLEFLESDDEDDAYQGDLSSVGGEPKRKRRKHKNLGDRVVGSTVYRVVKTSDDRLPPKRSHLAHHARMARMTKGRVPIKRSGGFFVKKQS